MRLTATEYHAAVGKELHDLIVVEMHLQRFFADADASASTDDDRQIADRIKKMIQILDNLDKKLAEFCVATEFSEEEKARQRQKQQQEKQERQREQEEKRREEEEARRCEKISQSAGCGMLFAIVATFAMLIRDVAAGSAAGVVGTLITGAIIIVALFFIHCHYCH